MDPRYSYYSSAQDSPSGHHSRHNYQPSRTPDPSSATPAQPYPYTHQHLAQSYHPGPAYPQHAPQYHPSPSPTTTNILPPLHDQPYSSRDVTLSGRHDVPSGFAVPSMGPTLHDLPFSASRPSSSAQSNRSSGHWGQPEARSPLSFDRTATFPGTPSRSSTYPPSRHGHSHGHGSPHPSLSQSTHLIPTPAQTVGAYHGYSAQPGSASSASSVAPVVASIPPASSSSPPQERYFCERCDKSFGRQHDKKRHFESTHLQQSHACRFCSKTFSRNDSLKRHQDNGCDKDPEFAP
ncbi:hypothetical protein C8Q74DRAFT_1217504 [Fomes fomentarius]|nr:hypothetical protein C8Q74DRAFT_1217504 [Fomes fomentarius]